MLKAFIITDDMVETTRFTLSGICGFDITAQTARKALESAQRVAPAVSPPVNAMGNKTGGEL